MAVSSRVWPSCRKFEEVCMSTLLQEIESKISGVKTDVARQNVGIVREASDGVAKIEGLTDAMLNEMLDFGGGVTGIALNLEETEVGAIILGDYLSVAEGAEEIGRASCRERVGVGVEAGAVEESGRE